MQAEVQGWVALQAGRHVLLPRPSGPPAKQPYRTSASSALCA